METSDWINLIAAILIGGGTLALAFMTWRSIRQTRRIQRSEKKERLLNEIIQWAEDIDIASLTPDISLIGRNIRDAQLLKTEHDTNTLLRYGIGRSKATSKLTIVEERFKGALLKHFNKALNELVEFVYIKQMMLYGETPDDKSFPESTVKRITKEIAKGDKSIVELFEEHAKNLAESIRNLIKEATKLKTRDID